MAELAERHGAWFHVDGAFGLFAALSPRTAHLVEGVERADSVIADGHKWLNVPYENGFAFVRDPALLPAVFGSGAAYLPDIDDPQPNWGYLGPEMSRRARAFPVWATLRAYGREGHRAIVEHDLDLAQRLAASRGRGARPRAPGGGAAQHRLLPLPARRAPTDGPELDDLNRRIGEAALVDGRVFFGSTSYGGRVAFRPALVNWRTRDEDVDLVAPGRPRTRREARLATSVTSLPRPRWRPAVIVVVAGLGIGVLTAYAQGRLPGSWGTLANSGAVWLVFAFAAGSFMTTDRGAAAAGFVTLLGAVIGYYVAVPIVVDGAATNLRSVVIWSGTALVGGPVFGVAGRWWRARRPAPRPAIALGLLGAALVGEGIYLAACCSRIKAAGFVMIAAGLVVPFVLGRSARERVIAFAIMVPLVAVALGVYQVINWVFLQG